jgi:hypothetical protein
VKVGILKKMLTRAGAAMAIIPLMTKRIAAKR